MIIEDLALVYVIECSMFSSKSFIVSGLIFRSLIHFEFIFVCGVRKCSNFILLHVAVVFPAPFIEEAVFAPLYILASFVKNKVPIESESEVAQLCPTLCDPKNYSLCSWNSPGKNTGVVCHSLLQRIFPTQELNLGLPHCKQILYCLSYQGSLTTHTHFIKPCPVIFI